METPNPEAPRFNVKVPDRLAAGAYSNNLVVGNTREEFILDFFSAFDGPPRLVARVLLSPPHAKRLARAIRDNIALCEKQFGVLPASGAPAIAQSVQAQQIKDFYSRAIVPDPLLSGGYANNAVIRHSRDEFVLDFMASFQPAAVVTARLLVTPPHLVRMVNSLEARLRGYEDNFGPLNEPPPNPRGEKPAE